MKPTGSGFAVLMGAWFVSAVGLVNAEGAPSISAPGGPERGAKIYAEKCLLCHQASGQGAPPVYPPLAGSDWLVEKREEVIRALCEGLSGRVVVNGREYENGMPAQVLDDGEVADVLSFVGSSWGNSAAGFTAGEVAAVRAKSRFKTYAALVKAGAYQALPQAPEGWSLREVVQLPQFCTRLVGRAGEFYVLGQDGSVFALDLAGALTPLVRPGDYAQAGVGVALGAALDAEGRLYVVTNRKVDAEPVLLNEVVVWRTEGAFKGGASPLKEWLKTNYPHGVGGMNHGVSHMAFGPDGMLYISSGSRTDSGESTEKPGYFKGGEVELTAALWRVDPGAAQPRVEVIARGIRNPYGFAWDGAGNLFTASNGPDYSAPEEVDFIVPGAHYGFPYQFADWPAREGFPYPHTPAAPAGVKLRAPVVNLGPAGGGSADAPLSTLDAHSCPGGLLWCGPEYPEPLGNSFVMTRFGNLLGAPAAPVDVGFDVLVCRMEQRPDGNWQMRARTLLAPLGRPIDVLAAGAGRVLVLEYTRPTNFKEGAGWLPGRILELAPVRPH